VNTVTSTVRTDHTWNTPENGLTAAYVLIVAFWGFYYYRPEDIIKFIYGIPLAKIIGGLALLSLVFGIMGQSAHFKLNIEAKLVLLLFLQCALTIPFATWKGGAFATVFEDFDKCILMTVMIGIAVTSVRRLKRLLFIQASAVAIMSVIGCIFFRGMTRLAIGTGLYANANDFAIMIALNWPICLGFLLATRNPIKKALWAIGLVAMAWAVTLTYSRSGFMALLVAVCFSFWEFGVRGKRNYIIVAGLFIALLLLPVMLPSHYGTRLLGIFDPSVDALDLGSHEARTQLLKESVKLTLEHPLFGVGPGNFASATQYWHVTHNTYTQLSSEAGIPALILFILILRQVFRNLRDIRKTERFRDDPEVQILTGALRASFAGYLLGAFFASYAYELFIYGLVAFTGVLYRACQDPPVEVKPKPQSVFTRVRTPTPVGVN
jgi:O-antigen ligase